MDYGRTELADRLAADYVTGTLRGPARRRFETLMAAHPALREAVRAWQDRLLPLTLSVTPQQPSLQLWQRIEARIEGAAAPLSARAAPPAATVPGGRWWARLAFWRGASALATVAALSLAVLLASPPPAQPPIVVVLESTAAPGGGAVVPASFVASISGDGRALVTRPLVNVSLQADRVLELWAAAGPQAPRSLGLISSSGATVVQQLRLPPGTDHLAVSLEPPGGSPTGAPTGPVLFVGRLRS